MRLGPKTTPAGDDRVPWRKGSYIAHSLLLKTPNLRCRSTITTAWYLFPWPSPF